MIIVYVPGSLSNSIDVRLPHANMTVDPRYIDDCNMGHTLRFSVNERILTITRIGRDEGWNADGGWPNGFRVRAYLPTENIPDFTSTVYLYWGLRHEFAPRDTTEVIFHRSVTTIQASAFFNCCSLVRITIPDTVTRIEACAFWGCVSLRFIRFSTNLEYMGVLAFHDCKSLEAVFLPPTVTHIDHKAFYNCTSLRFCNSFPDVIEHLGDDVFRGCDRLSTTISNNLSRVCYSTSVTPQSLQECIVTHGIERTTEVNDHQMTALHILCFNPHVTGDCIRAYLHLAPEATEQQDSDGMTPFHS